MTNHQPTQADREAEQVEVTAAARTAAAMLAERIPNDWAIVGGNDLAAIHNGFWDDDETDLGCLVQAFARFERDTIARIAAIEATGVAELREWRGIKSIPRDGTWVLVAPGHYGGEAEIAKAGSDGRPFTGDWDCFVHEATHWMPLPPPPAGQEG